MAARDPAWAKFKELLSTAMVELGYTAGSLSGALGVKRYTIENWRRGSAKPNLSQLREISRALGSASGDYRDDPLLLLRGMGILGPAPESDVVIDTAFRLMKLQMKIEEASELAVASGRKGGAARIVQAAMDSGKWAAACWPATEGPPDCRMRVADRIDIRRVDGADIDSDDIWADPTMKKALRSARAFPPTTAPASPHLRPERWPSPDDRAKVSQWFISHVGATKSPVVPSAKPELLTIAFTATTVDSWVNDVASLTALLIGYGFTSTRDMAVEITGTTSHSDASRAKIHERYLREIPRRRVWSHVTGTGPTPFADAAKVVNDQVFRVHLAESEDLLRDSATERDIDFGELRATAEAARQQALRLQHRGRLMLINTRLCEDRDSRWLQALNTVRIVYKELAKRRLLPDNIAEIHQTQWLRERDIVEPLLGHLGLPRPAITGVGPGS
ncbi:helix-turn-helix domain-containing protein [Microlunatus speluncae]|uniref:helix-turn-helix domain-containing protein n=1 Tax=Microlunatus speluncae TaxID=2594267 RepID=UPI0012661ADC|nr:helix-turn-helix transcriptional regulator [Microlunatus speluncae]